MIRVEATTQSNPHLSSTRRSFLRRLAAAGAAWRFLLASQGNAETIPSGSLHPSSDTPTAVETTLADGDSVRPFQINFPEATIVDLRLRIGATKWPELPQEAPTAFAHAVIHVDAH
jgi:hypothetical protein